MLENIVYSVVYYMWDFFYTYRKGDPSKMNRMDYRNFERYRAPSSAVDCMSIGFDESNNLTFNIDEKPKFFFIGSYCFGMMDSNLSSIKNGEISKTSDVRDLFDQSIIEDLLTPDFVEKNLPPGRTQKELYSSLQKALNATKNLEAPSDISKIVSFKSKSLFDFPKKLSPSEQWLELDARLNSLSNEISLPNFNCTIDTYFKEAVGLELDKTPTTPVNPRKIVDEFRHFASIFGYYPFLNISIPIRKIQELMSELYRNESFHLQNNKVFFLTFRVCVLPGDEVWQTSFVKTEFKSIYSPLMFLDPFGKLTPCIVKDKVKNNSKLAKEKAKDSNKDSTENSKQDSEWLISTFYGRIILVVLAIIVIGVIAMYLFKFKNDEISKQS